MASSADNWADDIHPLYFSKLQEDYETSRATRAESSASAYTFDNYQEDARITAIYPEHDTGSVEAINYVILGLVGEVGSIANAWKKVYRGDYTREAIEEYIIRQIGDALWYASRISKEFGYTFGDIAADNIRKLNDRQQRGTIRGSGDTR